MGHFKRRARIGVWGVGRHAQRTILPAIQRSADCEVRGIFTRDKLVALRIANEYKCQAWQSEQQMLEDPTVDAIYVATPTGLHYAHGLHVLEASKHLICEKSLALNEQQGMELVSQARARKVVLCEALMYLFHPRFGRLVELVRSGGLGAVRHIASSFCIPPLEQPGFRNSADLGGGALLDVGCYTLSAVLALTLATPRVQFAHAVRDAEGSDIGGTAVLGLDGSAYAVSNWAYRCAYMNEVTVVGESGIAHLDFVFAKGGEQCRMLCLRDGHGREEFIDCGLHDSFQEMLAAVYRATEDPAERERLLFQVERQSKLMHKVQTSPS